jgi:hypothetical protein
MRAQLDQAVLIPTLVLCFFADRIHFQQRTEEELQSAKRRAEREGADLKQRALV